MTSIVEDNSALPSISSGELFFRTTKDKPESWLSKTLGAELRGFLEGGVDDTVDRDFEARRTMLEDAEKLALECHRSMCRALEMHTISAEQLCRSFLSRSKTTHTGFRCGLSELLDEYDERCSRLAVWYYAALEREQEIYRRRMEEESLTCARLSYQVKESLRLSVFVCCT